MCVLRAVRATGRRGVRISASFRESAALFICVLTGAIGEWVEPLNCWNVVTHQDRHQTAEKQENMRRWCCDPRHGREGDAACFDTLFTYGICCRGENPFVDVPLDFAVVGFPHSGTTSLTKNLLRSNTAFVTHEPKNTTFNTELQLWYMEDVAGGMHRQFRDTVRAVKGKNASRVRTALKDPTAMYNHRHIYILSQIPRLRFVVLMRDPVAWLYSAMHVTAFRCQEAHRALGLCNKVATASDVDPHGSMPHGSTRNGRRPEAPPMAPFSKWLAAAEKLGSWDMFMDIRSANPFFSAHLHWLLNMVGRRRVILLSLEAIEESPRETLDALFHDLGVARLPWRHAPDVWSRGPRRRGGDADDGGEELKRLRRRLVHSGEYGRLCGLLRDLAPRKPGGGRLRLPKHWLEVEAGRLPPLRTGSAA